jgi:hypothetical protein
VALKSSLRSVTSWKSCASHGRDVAANTAIDLCVPATPFRFEALDNEDHAKLDMAMESLLDRPMIGIRSGKAGSL